jgi:hypothetical protein
MNDFDCSSLAVPEHKQSTTKRIRLESLPDEGNQPIDAGAKINRLDCQ